MQQASGLDKLSSFYKAVMDRRRLEIEECMQQFEEEWDDCGDNDLQLKR